MSQPLPQRPSRPGEQDQDQPSFAVGCASMLLAFMLMLVVVAGIIFLSFGLLTYALLAGVAFFAYAFFHYIVWGWWLAGLIRAEAEHDEEEEAIKPGAGP